MYVSIIAISKLSKGTLPASMFFDAPVPRIIHISSADTAFLFVGASAGNVLICGVMKHTIQRQL